MISKVLIALERGLLEMRSNSRLMFVAVLLFVFPLLFVWITQSFFEVSYSNIETTEKKRVSILHDVLATMLIYQNSDVSINQLITTVVNENDDITKIRIVEKDSNGFKILYANDPSFVGKYEVADDSYRSLPMSSQNQSIVVSTINQGVRTWQTFRSLELSDKRELFIFSEHSFAVVDSVMFARRQQSYLGLTAIFIFLIALAVWLKRQVNWEKSHSNLAKQMQERDLFSNMIAHEFRTPLTAIKGYSSFLLESKNLSTEENRFAYNIRTSAERLVILVNDFLEVSRLQSGKLKIENVEIDVGNIVKVAVQDLTNMAKEKGLSLNYKESSLPVLLKTDAARLTQVLVNLISNAIKYTERGSVEVKVTDTRAGVTIIIEDTGMGISADDQQKLFTPFTRVGDVDNTTITGTGLGMWITKQLVALLRGTVGIESIKGVGTHVVLNFKD